MRTLIIGAGVVGANVAARLVEEGHDVTVIDADPARLKEVTEQVDVRGLCGQGSHPETLREAGVASSDIVVALTDSDEVNIVTCLNASLLGQSSAVRVARVREPGYQMPGILADDGGFIDLIINPEQATAAKIFSMLRYPGVTQALEFADGLVSLIGILIMPDSPLAGLKLSELSDRFIENDFLVAAIERRGEIIIPKGVNVILPGDEVLLAISAEEIESTLAAVGIAVSLSQRVMILGSSPLARFLARGMVERNVSAKLIVEEADDAARYASELANIVVISGSPTDATLLQEENVGEMQTVIACDVREETNLMSVLLARRMGARRIISTTNELEFKPAMRAVGVDVCLSPRLVGLSAILKFVRQGKVLSTQAIGADEHVEALELEAQEGSPAIGRPIQELRLPRDVLVAAIVRDGMVLIPRGTTTIEVSDHVLVIAPQAQVHEVGTALQKPELESTT